MLEVFRREGILLAARAVMVFAAAFFGLCLALYIKKANIKEVLIVDDKGITDHTTAIALGFIPWEDIRFIRIQPYMSQVFVVVGVVNEDKYLSGLNWFKKKTILANVKMGFSICCINLDGTGVEPEEIVPKMDAMRERYGTV